MKNVPLRAMRFRSLAFLLACALSVFVLAGCGRGIYSDLELQNARFSVNEGGKAVFSGSIQNTGDTAYSSVYLVVDAYQGEELVTQLQTSARIQSGQKLEPGQTTGFAKTFEDGGLKPDRFEVVRLYGVE